MTRLIASFVVALTIGSLANFLDQGPRTRDQGPTFAWRLPLGFPTPRVPDDNPMTLEKVTLGRYLFYDTRLSGNGSQSCATCHEQARAFTDGRAKAVGSTGEQHPRSSMSLANVAYSPVLTWANPTITRLEDQALVPMFGDHPVELGLAKPGDELIRRLKPVPQYQRLFREVYGDNAASFTMENLTRALAAFERTIISGRSPYDRYHYGRQDDAISPSARRGEQLFFSAPLSCFRCHSGFTFSGATDFEGRRVREAEFHNTGLYNLAGPLTYPPPNTGIFDVTTKPEDMGKFKAPTLRNIAVTGPYMHDGSIATLEEVVDHYAAGGRTIADGPYRGVGHDNPNKSPLIQGFSLTSDQKSDLIAYLKTLTDEELLHDPDLANPWEAR
ncbi:MAG TPA: di-heme enzyme [Vicinamibacterales bacterium]|jgi:cytochrome c peroxidase|nr:di-heme enzyme [Vicinamibacterales bacterium]